MGGVRGQRSGDLRRATGPTGSRRHQPMSAHLKFGTIHPANDGHRPGIRDRDRPLTCVNSPSATSTVPLLHCWPHSAAAQWNRNFRRAIEVDTGDSAERAFEAWKQGAEEPAIRSSTPGCGSSFTGFMRNRVRMIVASFLVKICTSRGSGGAMVPRAAGRRRYRQQSARLAMERRVRHRRRPLLPGVPAPPRRAKSSTPRATTSGVGCRNWPMSKTCTGSDGPPVPISATDRRPRCGTWGTPAGMDGSADLRGTDMPE